MKASKAALRTIGRYANSRSAEPSYQQRAMGFEPTTSSLGSWHSTTELRPRQFVMACQYSLYDPDIIAICSARFSAALHLPNVVFIISSFFKAWKGSRFPHASLKSWHSRKPTAWRGPLTGLSWFSVKWKAVRSELRTFRETVSRISGLIRASMARGFAARDLSL